MNNTPRLWCSLPFDAATKRNLHVQPDIQYIINPGGYKSATNIWVFGIQLSVPL
jgi:carbohydrate-selective porin OprB